jgi:hypothetical protein
MTHNIHALREWIRVVVIVTAICTTAVPVLYSFFPWRSRPIGILLMVESISFALAMDLSALFTIWKPSDILIVFWIDAVMLTAIAVSTAAMAYLMLRILISQRR